jgi:L-lactate dehydrogenase complex protein LldG
MGSRDKILQALKAAQVPGAASREVPGVSQHTQTVEEMTLRFETTLGGIGGRAVRVFAWEEINTYLTQEFATARRIISAVPGLTGFYVPLLPPEDAHTFEDVDLIILQAHFGVAENGAAWVTDARMPDRALPFIAQNIALVLDVSTLVPTMQEAYARIGSGRYDFGTFIAGPSKTADIEQSLVLGAHGPKSMTVFLLQL